jgi:AraC family transcriptional regulator
VLKARLDRAQQLLAQADTPIAQIADLLGFTSQSHFTRVFKQFTGRTPSDFRRQKEPR